VSKKIFVVAFDATGTLRVSSNGKTYEYYHVSPYTYERITFLIRQKAYGKVWQLLKPYSDKKLNQQIGGSYGNSD
jgi:hypothetical protein